MSSQKRTYGKPATAGSSLSTSTGNRGLDYWKENRLYLRRAALEMSRIMLIGDLDLEKAIKKEFVANT